MTSRVGNEAVTDFDHHDGSVPAEEVRRVFAAMRDGGCPVVHSDKFGGFHYVNHHEDVRSVLTDDTTFSSGGDGVFIPESGLPRIPALEFDEPDHSMWREVLDGPLNPRAVREFEPTITEIANLLVDKFAEDGSADLVSSYAEPLPAIVIGRMVGLDQDEAVEVRAIAAAMFEAIGSPKFPDRQLRFVEFTQERLAERKAKPREDYLTQLASGAVGGISLDAAGVLTAYLLGGHHSTATGIAGLLRQALANPEVLTAAVGDRKVMARVIEESLRLTTPLPLFARTLTSAASIGGTALDGGGRILLNLAAANRDPAAFSDPESFEPGRVRNPHVAFGGGGHSCQGQHLARAEMRAAIEVIATRLPDVRLAGPVAEAGLVAGSLLPIVSIPVSFTPAPERG